MKTTKEQREGWKKEIQKLENLQDRDRSIDNDAMMLDLILDVEDLYTELKRANRQLQVVLDAISLADIHKQDIDRSKLKLAILRAGEEG